MGEHVSILLPVLVGTGATICTFVVHALAVATIVHLVRYERRIGRAGMNFRIDVSITGVVMLLALAAHLIEIGLWGGVFVMSGVFPELASAVYHSAVNYTTLGESNVLVSPKWAMLLPFEAADGMIMFGVSTAMLFAVIQLLVQTRFATAPDA